MQQTELKELRNNTGLKSLLAIMFITVLFVISIQGCVGDDTTRDPTDGDGDGECAATMSIRDDGQCVPPVDGDEETEGNLSCESCARCIALSPKKDWVVCDVTLNHAYIVYGKGNIEIPISMISNGHILVEARDVEFPSISVTKKESGEMVPFAAFMFIDFSMGNEPVWKQSGCEVSYCGNEKLIAVLPKDIGNGTNIILKITSQKGSDNCEESLPLEDTVVPPETCN